MKKITRRKFLADSGVLAAMLQTAGLLDSFTSGPGQRAQDAINAGLGFIGENGQNIVLYFINLQLRHGHLIPASDKEQSYIIAQLPPQSLHEEYFIQPTGPGDIPTTQKNAKLSTLCFLALQLWPDETRKKKLPFSPKNLFDWADAGLFKLMTTGDFAGGFQQFNKVEDVNNVIIPEKKAGDILDLNFYLSVVNKIITNSKEQPYLSIIELPQGLVLAPHTVKTNNTRVGLVQNTYRLSRQEHTLFINKQKVTRIVRERWNLQINYSSAKANNEAARVAVPPALRALAIFSGNAIQPNKNPGACAALPLAPAGNQAGFLPAFLDEVELAFLNQMTLNSPDFDITVDAGTPFLLTGSGATVKFTYKNLNIPPDPKFTFVSLVGYEHHFQDGRDNYIKIARIGVLAPSAQKAIHVKVAERTILGGESFMVYYEYIEIIEPTKTFPALTDNASGTYRTFPGYMHSDKNINFDSVLAGFKVTPRMASAANDGNQFWVYKEFSPTKDNDHLMLLPFNYADRNGKQVSKACDQPIYFMRRDFFCDKPSIDKLLGDGTTPGLMLSYDDGRRMRIPFNNQVVAFTPDDPAAQNAPGTPNKINQMETEFADYRFNVAAAVAGIENVFDTAKYPIYPQISRAKVFIDHIQQYSPDKIASLVEYHADYLLSGLAAANQAKLIAQHTKDFMAGAIKKIDGITLQAGAEYNQLNQTYAQIANLFNAAGDKIGGLVNPSIEIQRFALVKQAVTLPDNINQQWQSLPNKLHALDIFNGSSPQILNGIDLKMVLQDILDLGSTPLFDMSKITGAIDDINSFIQQLGNNPIVVKTVAAVADINTQLQGLASDVTDLQNKFNAAKQDVIEKRNALINQVPDINKLKNSLQLYLQTLKLAAFAKAGAAVADIQQYIKQQVVIAINQSNLQNNVIEDLLTVQDMSAVITGVIAQVQGADDDLMNQLSMLQNFLKGTNATLVTAYKNLTTRGLNDLYQTTDWIPADINLDHYYGANGLYTLQDQLTALTAQSAAGQNVANQIKTCQTQLAAAEATIDASIYNNINSFLKCYQVLLTYAQNRKAELESLYLFFNQYVQANIGYYVERYHQYQQDYTDIKNTIQTLETLFIAANDIVQNVYHNWQGYLKTYLDKLLNPGPIDTPQTVAAAWTNLNSNDQTLVKALSTLLNSPDGKALLAKVGAQTLLNDVNTAQTTLTTANTNLNNKLQTYQQMLNFQAEGLIQQLQDTFNGLLAGLDTEAIVGATAEFQQALKFLTNPIRQEISYKWQTEDFKSADLGIVKFIPGTDPKTAFAINVKGSITFDPRQLPQVAVKVETYAENSLTNFSVSFLSVISVDFASLTFVTGTNVAKNLSVKVRGVQFDGALSFIQVLEDMLGNLGDGFGMTLMPTGVSINYNSPVLGISAPAFTFSNISFGVTLTIYFDQRPMMLFFSLSRPECKATVAAGIYGGCFFCAVGIDPTRGIRSIEMALEMGAYLGISLGPISGSVKFMVGLYFKKDDSGVTMEGYFVAEGTLSVWILSVSARLYMYVRSQNSTITGGCTASYSVKLGFISKTFSGSYSKTIAGAENNHSGTQSPGSKAIQARLAQPAVKPPDDDLEDLLYAILEADDQRQLEPDEWDQFYQTFHK